MSFPLRRAGALIAAASLTLFAVHAAKAQEAQAQATKTYRIIGVGDIMMGSNYPQPIMHPKLTPGANPVDLIGSGLTKILRSGDVTFGNFEGTVHTRSKPHKFCRNPRYCYVFRSPPHHADFVKSMGFNMVSMANNHAGDFLDPGRTATWNNLKRAGLVVAGYDKPGKHSDVLTLSDGTKVGLIAFGHNPGLLWLTDMPRAKRLVRALAKRTDITIVSFHGGAEGRGATRVPRKTEIFLRENRGDVWRFSRGVIDAGADVVFGHGPHVPRAVEVYKRRFIIYSLGNFWTYGRFNLRGYAGLAPIADLSVTKKGRLMSARIHSAMQRQPGTPQIDPAGRAAAAVALLTKRDFPEGRLNFARDGTITGPGIGGR